MAQRAERFREYVRGSLWVLPVAAVVVALIAGSLLSKVSVGEHSSLHRLVFQGTAGDARNLLIGITSTMVTVIALVLGLMVVALQLSSTQYSPRILRNFLRDRHNKYVLSAFVATFAYSAAGLYTVGISAGRRTEDIPRLAITGAIVLLFISMIGLVYQVHHVAHSIQIDDIMRRIEDSTQEVVRAFEDRQCSNPPAVPADATMLRAWRSGYIQTIHHEELCAAAARLATNVSMARRVGAHVVSGTTLAWAWPADGGAVDEAALTSAASRAVRIGFERTLEQDAAFGLRQLVDVASKALSPAVNDPYTAVQAINHIAVIMASIARREQGSEVFRAGPATVTIEGWTFEHYLDLACAQIRRFGAGEPFVAWELIGMLGSLAQQTDRSERHAALRAQVDLIVEDASQRISMPADLARVVRAAERARALLSC